MKMFTANKKFGVGEVISIENNFMTTYYSEVDETKKTLLAYSPSTFDSYEAAAASIEEKEAATEIATEIENQKTAKIMAAGVTASTWLAEKNRQMAINQMKNI